ncbi:MAG: hypothetical protein LBS42_01865 [Tannerella sp.]|nr:hypothetical protein [Tannerella sp.]
MEKKFILQEKRKKIFLRTFACSGRERGVGADSSLPRQDRCFGACAVSDFRPPPQSCREMKKISWTVDETDNVTVPGC